MLLLEILKLAELLKRELDRLNELQKTPREHVDLDQFQLAFEPIAKQLLAKLASEPSQALSALGAFFVPVVAFMQRLMPASNRHG